MAINLLIIDGRLKRRNAHQAVPTTLCTLVMEYIMYIVYNLHPAYRPARCMILTKNDMAGLGNYKYN